MVNRSLRGRGVNDDASEESPMTGYSHADPKALLEERLRTLAKNMSGISEGGGKPGELTKEIVDVAEALIAFEKAFGTRPNAELIRRVLEKKVPKKE